MSVQDVSASNYQSLLMGNDMPGSLVKLTIIKAEDRDARSFASVASHYLFDRTSDVKLRRMACSEVNDNVG